MSESTLEQVRIEQDLAQTRSRMDERLNALQDRLTPGQILDDLVVYFRGSAGDDFVRNLMNSVRNNPMPAALTGIGLTWLMASNPHPQNDRPRGEEMHPDLYRYRSNGAPHTPSYRPAWNSHAEFDTHFRDLERNMTRQTDETDSAHRDRLNTAMGASLGVSRKTEDTADSFGQRIQDAMASARQSITDMARDFGGQATDLARNLGGQAGDMASRMGGMAQSAGEQFVRGGQAAQQFTGDLLSNITNNPVLLGALGVAAGAILGALVPQSDQEEAALGSVAGQARDGVSQLAQDLLERGGTVAQKVMDAGRESVSTHGLAGKSLGDLTDAALSGGLAKNVGEVAREVLTAGDKALRANGSDGDDAGAARAGEARAAATSPGAPPASGNAPWPVDSASGAVNAGQKSPPAPANMTAGASPSGGSPEQPASPSSGNTPWPEASPSTSVGASPRHDNAPPDRSEV